MKKNTIVIITVAVIAIIAVIIINNKVSTPISKINNDNPQYQQETNVMVNSSVPINETGNESSNINSKIDITTFSMDEVNKHNSKNNCWMVIDGKVYDATNYIASGQHKPIITQGCGVDATVMFEEVKKHSSPKAKNLLDQFLIGTLK